MFVKRKKFHIFFLSCSSTRPSEAVQGPLVDLYLFMWFLKSVSPQTLAQSVFVKDVLRKSLPIFFQWPYHCSKLQNRLAGCQAHWSFDQKVFTVCDKIFFGPDKTFPLPGIPLYIFPFLYGGQAQHRNEIWAREKEQSCTEKKAEQFFFFKAAFILLHAE